jgi:hypothetical protein
MVRSLDSDGYRAHVFRASPYTEYVAPLDERNYRLFTIYALSFTKENGSIALIFYLRVVTFLVYIVSLSRAYE